MDSQQIIDLITAGWLGFLGACVGSFLNVVAYRLPLGLSVVWKGSHCPHCKHAIRARDNVPVLGWLWLRGKCRDCGAPISPRYAVVEAIMAVVFVGLAYVELFTGGANLPGGPLTDRTGATDIVWDPHWPTIAAYSFHVVLASTLVTLCLLRLDKYLSSSKFFALSSCVLLAWFAVPFLLAG